MSQVGEKRCEAGTKEEPVQGAHDRAGHSLAGSPIHVLVPQGIPEKTRASLRLRTVCRKKEERRSYLQILSLFPASLDGVCFTERSLLSAPGLGCPCGLCGSHLGRPGPWGYLSAYHGGHAEAQLCSWRGLRWPRALGGEVMAAVAGDPLPG